jgi:hypothetical protein
MNGQMVLIQSDEVKPYPPSATFRYKFVNNVSQLATSATTQPAQYYGGRAETGESALDKVDPDKDTQPEKARMDPLGQRQ